jgi:hypothetical protein
MQADESQRVRAMLERGKADHESTSIELTAIIDRKKQDIQRLEEDNSKLRLQVSSLERIFSQEKQSKSNAEGEMERKSALTMQLLKEELT